jgi:hypothetical protein
MELVKNRGRIETRIPPSTGQLRVTKVLKDACENLSLGLDTEVRPEHIWLLRGGFESFVALASSFGADNLSISF